MRLFIKKNPVTKGVLMCAKNSHKKRFFCFFLLLVQGSLVTLCQKLLCYRWISLCCIACYRLPLLVLEGQEQQRNGARKITIYSTAADICKNETYFPGPFISATTAEIINSVVRLDLLCARCSSCASN